MGYEKLLTAEMVTAFAVFLGALFGGVVAVISELRRPAKPGQPPDDTEEAVAPRVQDLMATVQEETDHLNRTIWLIEKRLSDHLHEIEKLIIAHGKNG